MIGATALDEEAVRRLLAERQARGAALRQLLYEESTLRWLPDGASTWCAGGCLVLAQGLSALIDGEVVVIASRRGPEHLVVRVGDVYLDGDGVSTARSYCTAGARRRGCPTRSSTGIVRMLAAPGTSPAQARQRHSLSRVIC